MSSQSSPDNSSSDNSRENVGAGSGGEWHAQGISAWARHGLEEMAERGQIDRAEQGLPDDTWVGLLSDVQDQVDAEGDRGPVAQAADDAEHYGSGAGSPLPIDRSQESGKVV